MESEDKVVFELHFTVYRELFATKESFNDSNSFY